MKNKLANFQKKFGFLVILIIGGFLVLFQFSKIVFAEEVAKEKPTEIQISKISKKCNDLKNNLKKLRSEDALKRVNLGKSYEKISNGLMSNFNARILKRIFRFMNGSFRNWFRKIVPKIRVNFI